MLNGAAVAVTITNDGTNGYRISSAATRDGKTTTIVAYLNPGGGAYQSIFHYAAASLNGNITMSGATCVTSTGTANEGDIYANGNISLTWGPYVNGDANATGTITDTGSGIAGTSTPSTSPLPAPDMSVMISQIKSAATSVSCPALTGGNWSPSSGIYTNPRHVGGTMSTGYSTASSPYVFSTVYVGRDFTISGANSPTFNDNVYVARDISFANGTITYGSNANIIADGDIELSGAASVQTGTEWPLINSTDGDITLSNSGTLVGAVYAPNGTFRASGAA